MPGGHLLAKELPSSPSSNPSPHQPDTAMKLDMEVVRGLDEICAGTCPEPPSGVITGSIMCAGQAGVVPPELELILTDSVSRVLRAIAPVQASGRFEITGVPLGAWRLEVNQRAKVLSVLHVRLVRDTLGAGDVRVTCR